MFFLLFFFRIVWSYRFTTPPYPQSAFNNRNIYIILAIWYTHALIYSFRPWFANPQSITMHFLLTVVVNSLWNSPPATPLINKHQKWDESMKRSNNHGGVLVWLILKVFFSCKQIWPIQLISNSYITDKNNCPKPAHTMLHQVRII